MRISDWSSDVCSANTAREWAFSVIGGRNFMAVWCRIFEESAGPAGQLFLVCPQQLAKLQRNRENNSGVLFPRNDNQRTQITELHRFRLAPQYPRCFKQFMRGLMPTLQHGRA